MSLGEISVAVTADNQASEVFQQIGADAATMGQNIGVSLRSMSYDIRSVVMFGSEITRLAANTGILNKEQEKWMQNILLGGLALAGFVRVLHVLNDGQIMEGALYIANTAKMAASMVVRVAYEGVMKTATAISNAFNISQAAGLALTVVGIAAIVAATIAVAAYAASLNSATSSMNNFNSAASNTSGATRGILRAGEQSMLLRGVEG